MAKLRLKVRFDYVGRAKNGKMLIGGKSSEQVAESLRQHKIAMIRNVPIQGIIIEDIDMSQEVYSVYDEISGKEIAYAPVVVSFSADSLEDAVRFSMKEEFRTIQVIEPEDIQLNKIDIERLLMRISSELLDYKRYLERKINNWK
ncbi:hypothetical protein [Syntrophomonas palmitatica]|uniref:hypothetical protein n=1 Tax=Syntrophomonas palmitatica TaxID=402877 RepID=UPI0006D28FD7|nr:hypothetical protein [Syntrophomonas palmitatica]